MPESLELAAVEARAKHHALTVRSSRGPHLVSREVDDVVARGVSQLLAGVSEVEVQLTLGAEHEGVGAVIVLPSLDSREEHLLTVRDVVTVIVVKDEDVRGARHDDLRSEHADPQGGVDARILIVHLGLVGPTIPGGVLQDHDAIALGLVVLPSSVIHSLRDPDASSGVDVHVRGVHDHRLVGKECHLHAVRDVQPLDRFGRRQGATSRRSPAAATSPARRAGVLVLGKLGEQRRGIDPAGEHQNG